MNLIKIKSLESHHLFCVVYEQPAITLIKIKSSESLVVGPCFKQKLQLFFEGVINYIQMSNYSKN